MLAVVCALTRNNNVINNAKTNYSIIKTEKDVRTPSAVIAGNVRHYRHGTATKAGSACNLTYVVLYAFFFSP